MAATTPFETLVDSLQDRTQRIEMPYPRFLEELREDPEHMLRDVFLLFHDMIMHYVPEGWDEYPDDTESIGYVHYDFDKLLHDDCEVPFFADRLFANRFMEHVSEFAQGTNQKNVFIFDGPAGSGKSLFMKNLLQKFQEYANLPEGANYELLWKLTTNKIGDCGDANCSEEEQAMPKTLIVPCPSHDHPILIIPKKERRQFLDDILQDGETKERIMHENQYNWVFEEDACSICTSLFEALSDRLGSVKDIFSMIHARNIRYNRSTGQGISVLNPGDDINNKARTNEQVQKFLNRLFKDSDLVKFIYSGYAKTNNGIYVLMDIKEQNTKRFKALHNLISDGLYKIEDIEERIRTLRMAISNPEDLREFQEQRSFRDRIELISIDYALESPTEVKIYKGTFNGRIGERFLPGVLENFAKAIISTRLRQRSPAIQEWLGNVKKYEKYLDRNAKLLKMEIYKGHIPEWLEPEDRERFNRRRRRAIINESENEGKKGISGRDSIRYFKEFLVRFSKPDHLITMEDVVRYFQQKNRELELPSDLDLSFTIPAHHGSPERSKKKDLDERTVSAEFLDSLQTLYNYEVIQQIKDAMYDFNETQAQKEVLHYLHAINYDSGTQRCQWTGQDVEVNQKYFRRMEKILIGSEAEESEMKTQRIQWQREYVREIQTEGLNGDKDTVMSSEIFQKLYSLYKENKRESVLEELADNEDRYRNATKDFGKKRFTTSHDKRVQSQVTLLLKNLQEKFGYTEQGAKQIVIYAIDKNLAYEF